MRDMVESAGTVTGTMHLGVYWGIAFVCLIIVVVVAAIFLQIWLSLSDRRWPGLILPAIAFVGALIYLVQGNAFSPLFVMEPGKGAALGCLLLLAYNYNTTVPLLALYAACRLWGQRKRRKQELNKMNSQDLS